jgi:hypothetical protein
VRSFFGGDIGAGHSEGEYRDHQGDAEDRFNQCYFFHNCLLLRVNVLSKDILILASRVPPDQKNAVAALQMPFDSYTPEKRAHFVRSKGI